MAHAPAPDSPSLLLSVNLQKYGVKKRKLLSAEDAEQFELAQAAGITMDPEVFKVLVDLLKMNVAPHAVFQTLKGICTSLKFIDPVGKEVNSEVKEEDPGKTLKPSAAGLGSGQPSRTTNRINSKTTTFTPTEPLPPQGSLRNKTVEKKLQRQPSASRGQKSKSPGSSSSSQVTPS